MKKSIAFAVCFVLGVAFAHARASAAAEFCPAEIASVSSVADAANTFAVRMRALSPRSVTGEFLVESDAGWYSAPFPPVRLDKAARTVESPLLYITLPQTASIENVWLARAASDDSLWGPRGIVSCPPASKREIPAATAAKSRADAMLPAHAIPAPFSYHCATPFADAKINADAMDPVDFGPGEYASVRVDLDASGNPVDVTVVDASGADFNLGKALENAVKKMQFTPAIAYCKPVPSSSILSQGAGA